MEVENPKIGVGIQVVYFPMKKLSLDWVEMNYMKGQNLQAVKMEHVHASLDLIWNSGSYFAVMNFEWAPWVVRRNVQTLDGIQRTGSDQEWAWTFR